VANDGENGRIFRHEDHLGVFPKDLGLPNNGSDDNENRYDQHTSNKDQVIEHDRLFAGLRRGS